VQKDIIETDLDTAIEDKNDNGSIYPYDPTYKDIEMGDTPFSVFEYLRQHQKGKIISSEIDFQRNLVWNITKKSNFIESIILNYPIPPIYLSETIDGNYNIIDGLQRTSALNEFYNGKFSLAGLEALPRYNGFFFKDLPEALQSKFEDKKLTIFSLKPSTPMVVVYDLFNRINTGGTQLNRQEVRNCIFIGKSTKLLKELSEQYYFQEAIDWGVKPLRMKDREVILRYIAFRWFDYQNDYTGDMSQFVENAMKQINKMPDSQIEEIKVDFKRVMEWSLKIWGRENFRIPTELQSRGTINTAVLETVCNYLSSKSDDFLNANKKTIRENYFKLFKDKTYYEAVTKSTGNKAKVLDRFWLTHEILSQNDVCQPKPFAIESFNGQSKNEQPAIKPEIKAKEATISEAYNVFKPSKSKEREKISVTFPDGEAIKTKKVVDTFLATIKKIGIERIKELEISRSTVPIISETKYNGDISYTQHRIGKYWIMTTLSTSEKFKVLIEINQRLNLNLKILKA
jgi:hypothetical protein